MRIAEWILINLRLYGNCLIPKKLINRYGIVTMEKELTVAVGNEIRIKAVIFKTDGVSGGRGRKDIGYIAETERYWK